jgi:hypothetical protein
MHQLTQKIARIAYPFKKHCEQAYNNGILFEGVHRFIVVNYKYRRNNLPKVTIRPNNLQKVDVQIFFVNIL